MGDAVLIASMVALFAFGLIPIIKLDRFLRSRRNIIAEPKRRSEKKKRRSEADPIEEFENSGILCFDPPRAREQIGGEDIKRMEHSDIP